MPGSSKQLHHTFQGQKLTGAQSPLDFGLSYWTFTYNLVKHMGDFQKNEDFSFSENNLNIKWYERKVNILKQAQW